MEESKPHLSKHIGLRFAALKKGVRYNGKDRKGKIMDEDVLY
jgi:hypothetical protein